MEKFDAIIIGTGQAGPAMANRCASEGLKTAIIEKGKFGGVCVNTGCTPTKTMVASARTAFMVSRASEFGVTVEGDIKVDLKKVKERKDNIVNESNSGLEKRLKETDNLTVIEGHARFTSNNTIKVNDRELQADKIFIDVGTRPNVPEEYQEVDYLTNASIMELEEVPAHLIIIGGSYIGLEFGQMFRRFGSKVTIVEKGRRVTRKEDEDVSEAIQNILKEENIAFRFNANCIGAKMVDGKVEVSLDCDAKEKAVTGTHLLLAIGRVPNTDDLGLEHTDLEIDDRGYIEVNDQLETNVKGIWAVGDCNGKGAFTHTAYNDNEIVMANIFDAAKQSVKDRITCYGLFIDPPLGRVGLTESQVRDKGINALITTRPMTKVARAKEMGETKGFMKVITDADTDKILGAMILGTTGDETVHLFLEMMAADQPYTVIQNTVHIHPTVTELFPTLLDGLAPLE